MRRALTERQNAILGAIFKDRDTSGSLSAFQNGSLSFQQMELACDLLGDEILMKGVDENFKATAYGREIEEIQFILKYNFELSKKLNEFIITFTSKIVEIEPALAGTLTETTKYWEPEIPPATIVYGALGQSVVENFERLGGDRIREIMALVEEGITSEDEALRTAVATGFIEAMVGQAEQVEGRLARILSTFGPQSRFHAEAWANF